ncbi:MAG TPA: hypothetical protein VK539_21695 [Myxococcaceae bacterium]|nr:hypothetical protein [Myxococcaceae bacterium]
MPSSRGKKSKESLLPDRVKLRNLRDQYMSEMAALSYDEVKDKFLQELRSKRGEKTAESPRERGLGIWNSAFGAKPEPMHRSSIVLLAEFFAVSPEELILKQAPESSPDTEEDDTMTELHVEPAMKSLIAFHQRSPTLGIQKQNLCRQLSELLQRHLPLPLSELIREGHSPDVERLREVLLEASRVEPEVHTLVMRISNMSVEAKRAAPRSSKPTVNGDHNQVLTIQGDIKNLHGSLFTNNNTFNTGPGKKGKKGPSSSK